MKKLIAGILLIASSALAIDDITYGVGGDKWSNAVVKINATKDLAESTSNRVTAIEGKTNTWDAVTTNTAGLGDYGAYVITETNAIRYSTFTNAYAQASAGDTVQLSSGTFDLGNITFSFNKEVNVRGAGSDATTLQANGFLWTDTATNCSLIGVEITQEATDSVDCFNSTCQVDDLLNIRMVDVFVNQAGTGNHCFEVTGGNITLDRVRTYARKGHAFSMKGVSNLVVRNCQSELGASANNEGFLIKADATDAAAKGNCDGVIIDGFRSNAKGFIQPASNGSSIKNVKIKNMDLNVVEGDSQTYGIECGFGGVGLTDNYIENIYIENIIINNASSPFIATLLTGVTNLVVKNLSAYNCSAGALLVGSTVPKKNVNFSNIDIFMDDGWRKHISDGGKESYTRTVDPISSGVLNAYISGAAQTTTGLWVTVTAGYEPSETALAVGDPVWITAGSKAGVYRLEEFGTVITTNLPITGSAVGDYYIRITDATTTSDTAITLTGDILMGKLLGAISEPKASSSRYSLVGTVEASGYFVLAAGGQPTPKPSYSKCDFGMSIHPSVTPRLTISASTPIAGEYLDIKPHVFVYDSNQIYVGIFCPGVATDSYVPAEVDYPTITLNQTSSIGAGYGLYETSVLP